MEVPTCAQIGKLLKNKDVANLYTTYLTEIVERIHKYHIAYKTMLYE